MAQLCPAVGQMQWTDPSVSATGQPWLLFIQVPAAVAARTRALTPLPCSMDTVSCVQVKQSCNSWSSDICKTWNWVIFQKKCVSPADTGHLNVGCLCEVTHSVEWRILQRLTAVLNYIRNQEDWGFGCLNFEWSDMDSILIPHNEHSESEIAPEILLSNVLLSVLCCTKQM